MFLTQTPDYAPLTNISFPETSSRAESQIREGGALAPWVHTFVWHEYDARLGRSRSPATGPNTSEQLVGTTAFERM